jgi:isoquinoline 1-oxidoreductase beta subunit
MNHMPKMPKINRRAFVAGSAAIGGGLALGFHVPFATDAALAADAPEVNAWVVIKPDDSVVIRIARSEMGQGTQTGLAQLVAEELQCDWSKVSTEFPSAGANLARKRVWGDMSTGGSRGIRASHQYVRQGGAAAREMLIQAAANEWKVPASECSAANSVITHKASGRTTTYGKVADAAAKIEPPKDVKLKDVKDWTIAGKPLKRLDTLDKLTGKMTYGIDIKMPNMVVATIRDAPVRGNKVKSFDAAKVEKMAGVKKVVPVGDSAVAVVADTFWHAKTAMDALPIVWEETPNNKVSSQSIAEMLKAGLDAEQAFVGNKTGDAKAALAGAARKITAEYSYPFQNHVTMEPMNATALYTADKLEVWGPTQNAEAGLAAASEASGMPIAKCDFHKVHLGGGFGRRGRADYVSQVAMIAKQMPGVPVKLIWTREEDMTHCAFHPVTQCRMTAGIDAGGNVTGLHMRISGSSILASLAPDRLENGMDGTVFQGLTASSPEGHLGYNIPNVLVDHAMRNPHIQSGFWRGVNVNHNAIYVETFIDELAHELKQDQLEFRLKLLKPKHAAVLKSVADKAGWGKPPAAGIHRGLAQFMGYGSYVAACAEISVENGNRIKIHRIFAATDPGTAVNPAQIERQTSGSFIYGLTALIYGEITIKDGAVEQKNFDTYDSMRIREQPHVETTVMPSGGFWGGVGEPTIAVAAPAVLNAYFAATGKRIRTFPLKNHDIRTA